MGVGCCANRSFEVTEVIELFVARLGKDFEQEMNGVTGMQLIVAKKLTTSLSLVTAVATSSEVYYVMMNTVIMF
jgi:hypothetical protein